MTISEPTSPPEAISTNNNNDDDGGVNTIVSTIQARFQQMKVSSSSSSSSAAAEAPEAEDDSAAAVLSLYKDYQRILSVGEECINPNELLDLLIRQGRGSVKRSSISTTTSATNTTTEAALVNDDDIDDTERALGFQLYDGFEPSGRMHIAQGIFKVHNVNKCTYQNNGGTFIFWIADWFALMKYVFINGVVL